VPTRCTGSKPKHASESNNSHSSPFSKLLWVRVLLASLQARPTKLQNGAVDSWMHGQNTSMAHWQNGLILPILTTPQQSFVRNAFCASRESCYRLHKKKRSNGSTKAYDVKKYHAQQCDKLFVCEAFAA
jgi:hypothetical protein